MALKHQPGRSVSFALELTNTDADQKRKSLMELDETLPPSAPLFTSAVSVTLAEQASWVAHPGRLVGIGAFPTLLGGSLIEFSTLEQTHPEAVRAARAFASALGKEPAIIRDTPGMILPRILCMIINEACFALGEELASPSDIDTAMKLGTHYPSGPLAWAELIGPRQVYAVMSAVHSALGDDRYRIAPVLRQAAMIGSFHFHDSAHGRR